ncbi:hypothetical protein JCGZ_02412 [Jatropha curcas]|uniref:Uncharacterized protein n=1 Tax=Jatropha curcas TaxID=180498 RepID=A0A067LER9_JATCU|nr:hypothetical protein JCGZ_02412 [Jatropha curcas]
MHHFRDRSVPATLKRLDLGPMKFSWGDVANYPNFVQAAIVHQQRWLLLPGHCSCSEGVSRHGPITPDSNHQRNCLLWIKLNPSHTGLAGFARFCPAEKKQRGKRVRGSSDSRVLDTTVIVSKPEYGPGASISFILDHTGQLAQGMLETHLVCLYRMSPPGCTLVSIANYNRVSQLYEAARLKLGVARLFDKHVSISINSLKRKCAMHMPCICVMQLLLSINVCKELAWRL